MKTGMKVVLTIFSYYSHKKKYNYKTIFSNIDSTSVFLDLLSLFNIFIKLILSYNYIRKVIL